LRAATALGGRAGVGDRTGRGTADRWAGNKKCHVGQKSARVEGMCTTAREAIARSKNLTRALLKPIRFLAEFAKAAEGAEVRGP